MTPTEAYVRESAIRNHIDPDVAVRVANHEGLRVFDPGRPDLGGDDRSSFGIYQLHYGGLSKAMPNGGLGDEFTKATGLDARDPRTWKQQVDFAHQWAAKHGWGSWMGAKAEGIGDWQGIGAPNAAGTAVAQASKQPGPNLATTMASAVVPPDDSGPMYFEPQARSPFEDSSTLADTLSSRVGKTLPVSGLGDAATAGGTPPAPDFASAIPETPPPAAAEEPSLPLAADATQTEQSDGGLASLFKLPEIGAAGVIDPATGLPKMPRYRRTYG